MSVEPPDAPAVGVGVCEAVGDDGLWSQQMQCEHRILQVLSEAYASGPGIDQGDRRFWRGYLCTHVSVVGVGMSVEPADAPAVGVGVGEAVGEVGAVGDLSRQIDTSMR